jgi:hypothetical protein
MTRITQGHLERQVDILNSMTGGGYVLGWAYGGVRLEKDNGSRDISPRGTKRQVSEYVTTVIQVLSQEQKRQNEWFDGRV